MLAYLDQIINRLTTIKEVLMTIKEELDAIKTAADAVAARLATFLTNVQLTPDQQAEGDAIVAELNGLASAPPSPPVA
jgi:hypothetical protein